MSATIVPSFDFDSTLANTDSLHYLIDRENNMDWDNYGVQCAKHATEGPAYPIARYLSIEKRPWVITSGRAAIAREESLEWLHNRGLYPWAVFLADDRHDRMSHAAWKIMRLREIQQENNWVIPWHMDDIDSVAQEGAKHLDDPLVPPIILVHSVGRLPDRLG